MSLEIVTVAVSVAVTVAVKPVHGTRYPVPTDGLPAHKASADKAVGRFDQASNLFNSEPLRKWFEFAIEIALALEERGSGRGSFSFSCSGSEVCTQNPVPGTNSWPACA